MNGQDQQVGWVITNADPDGGDESRIGYGQATAEAVETVDSYKRIIGRTSFMQTGLSHIEIPADKRVKWRSYDDDGGFCYEGFVHINWLFPSPENDGQDGSDVWDTDEEPAYNINRFNEADVGAVIVIYNGTDIIRCDESKRQWVEKHPRMERKGFPAGNWLPIYG